MPKKHTQNKNNAKGQQISIEDYAKSLKQQPSSDEEEEEKEQPPNSCRCTICAGCRENTYHCHRKDRGCFL